MSKQELKIPRLSNIISNKELYDDDNNIINPPNDQIITSNEDGTPLSVYGDDVWDFTLLRSNQIQPKKMIFNKFLNKENTEVVKRIMFIVMITGSSRSVSSLISVGTLYNLLMMVLKPLEKYILFKNIKYEVFFESNTYIKEYITQFIYSKFHLEHFKKLINILSNVDTERRGFRLDTDSGYSRLLIKRESELSCDGKQTVMIPTRIFNESISQRLVQIDIIYRDKEKILSLVKYLLYRDNTKSGYLRSKDFRKQLLFIEMDILLKELDVNYSIDNSKRFIYFIRLIQNTVRHLILALTGMRDGESLSLSHNCFELLENKNIIHIIGNTTKLTERKTESKWIGSSLLLNSFKLLQEINYLVADRFNIAVKEMPLFWSTSLLHCADSDSFIVKNYIFQPQLKSLSSSKAFLIKNLIINEDDIKELIAVDYHFDWKEIEDFKIGNTWKFKAHQYRRSLAIYSLQSGLISIGSLQSQLKHLLREMTLYYSNGASRAKALFKIDKLDKLHIGNHFNELEPEIKAMSYISNTILSDRKLFGSHGKFIESTIKQKINNSDITILEFKKETEKRIRKGEMSGMPTPLGWCISPDSCDKRMLRSIYGCIGCEDAVVELEKLENIIFKQKDLISLLDENSFEYKLEVTNLEELIKGYNILSKGDNLL